MAGQSGILAGKAFVQLFSDDNALVKGLNAAQAKLKAFGNALKSVGIGLGAAGGAIIAPILASARSFATAGDALDKMSQRTGVAVDALSELSGAALLTGTNIDEVENALKHMEKTVFAASQQTEEAAQALAYLGLTAAKLKGMNPQKQFELIAEKITGIQDPIRRAAVTMEIFGSKTGTQILPLIANLKEAKQEAHDMGAVMSTEDVTAASNLMHVFHLLELALQGVYNAIGADVAPVLTEWLTITARVIASTSQWIRDNKDLVVAALEIGVALFAAGAAFIAVGSAIVFVGAVMGALAAIWTTGFAIASAATAFLGSVLAALATPVGIVLVALTTLLGVLVYYSDLLGDVADAAESAFGSMKAFALNSFGAIKDALLAGDIVLAAQVLWATMKVIWQTGVNWLYGIWIQFARAYLVVVDVIVGGFAIAFDTAVNYFYKLWNEAVGWLAKKFATLAGTIQNVLAYFGLGDTADIGAITKRIDAETTRNNKSSDANLETGNKERERQLDMDSNYGSSQLAQSQADLDKAKGDLTGLIAQAHQEGAAAAVPKAQKKISQITPDLDKVVKGDVQGTFNGNAAGRLGSGTSAAERTAKAAEAIAQSTQKIAQNTDPNSTQLAG